eukprot:16364138-Heterocapsa_arctica.AAC.1
MARSAPPRLLLDFTGEVSMIVRAGDRRVATAWTAARTAISESDRSLIVPVKPASVRKRLTLRIAVASAAPFVRQTVATAYPRP